jgi:hypothetical protein
VVDGAARPQNGDTVRPSRPLIAAATAALALGLAPLGAADPAGAASEASTAYAARTLRVLEGDDPPERVEDLADALDGGTSRRAAVAGVVADTPYRATTIDELYRDVLGRTPSAADRTYWADRLAAVGEYRVRAELLSSAELLASSGGTKEGFVEAVYQYGLGRSAEPTAVTYWTARTGDTAVSRSQVAWWVLRSNEGRSRTARALFEEILGRTPESDARAFFAGRLQASRGIESVTVELAAAPEALSEAQKADTLVALLDGSRLVLVDAETLDVLGDEVQLPDSGATNPQNGITPGTDLVAIDVRPHTQVLYGLGGDGQLYSLNMGNATAVKVDAPIATLAGDVVGLDFNPVVDRLRVTTASGENLRVNPDTGAIAATDTPLAYATGDRNEGDAPGVTASAYTNSARGALGAALPASTTLFDLDPATDALVRQDPPNDGTLVTVGAGLGADVDGGIAFDISPDTRRAWAVTTDGSTSQSHRIDLTSGRVVPQGSAALAGPVLGIAVAPTAPAASGQGWLLSSGGDAHSVTAVALGAPGTAAATLTITGVTAGTTLTGLDVRSATGMPYALGSDGQLYVLGAPKAATPTVVPAEKVGAPIAAAASTGEVGFDFNPAVDRLRILVGTTNLRVNPNTGTLVDGDPATDGVQPDGALAYAGGDPNAGATPNVVGGAYTNAPRGGVATATQLLDVDSAADVLALQDPPNAGTLVTRGPLGADVGDDGGFDVQTGTGTAYLVTTVGGTTALHTVDLATGAATLVGATPAGLAVTGFATT